MRLSHRALFPLALLLTAAIVVPAQEAEVAYLEGFPELRSAGGDRYELDFGDLVESGDSVITGATDYAELERGGVPWLDSTGSAIRCSCAHPAPSGARSG